MNFGFFRIEKEGFSLLGGILFVVLLGGVLRPYQSDNAHTIGLLNAKGGRAIHEGNLYLGRDFFGEYSLLLTATVLPPVSGDIQVKLQGPENVNYQISSRNPPGVPIVNRFHPWYRLEGQTLKSVRPLDDLIVYLKMKAPTKPGHYELILSDVNNPERVYLSMPLTFSIYNPATAAKDPLEDWPCH